jgi:hypothetical protein
MGCMDFLASFPRIVTLKITKIEGDVHSRQAFWKFLKENETIQKISELQLLAETPVLKGLLVFPNLVKLEVDCNDAAKLGSAGSLIEAARESLRHIVLRSTVPVGPKSSSSYHSDKLVEALSKVKLLQSLELYDSYDFLLTLKLDNIFSVPRPKHLWPCLNP